jgi:protein-S-isoprenylcysteine O-methyltransferase Ste14
MRAVQLPHKFFIDSHKGSNAVAIVALMAWFDAWHNETAWVYLALHGTYGLLWLLKSNVFPDKQWEQPVPWSMGLATWAFLTLYWVGPYVITSRDLHAAPWLLGLCVAMWGLGVCLHFASDMQKHMHLQLRPGTLLQHGLWARNRNPNYLGELLIYSSFCLLSRHWAPMAVLGLALFGLWLPNMLKKDRSLSRYPEFAAWKRRSCMLVPYVF